MVISPSKLQKLPRSQRLRKIGKMFGEAENRLCRDCPRPCPVETTPLSPEEIAGLADMADLLLMDPEFPFPAREALEDCRRILRAGNPNGLVQEPAGSLNQSNELRRGINTVRHILLSETGRSPADWDFIDPSGSLDPARRRAFPGMTVYFEDIRSPFNVGAMFRTAESFGAEKIFLSPLCADPAHPRAQRSAMGCTEILPWERRDLFASSGPLPSGEAVFALETGGLPLKTFPFPPRGTMIAGSEELGVSPRALAAADASLGRVSIPTYGAKGSLNVSAAFGIVMQVWAERLAGGTLNNNG